MIQTLRDTTVSQIEGRLSRRFPLAPPARVAAAVTDEYDALADNPIQMYIANLVEHAARDRLRRDAAPAH